MRVGNSVGALDTSILTKQKEETKAAEKVSVEKQNQKKDAELKQRDAAPRPRNENGTGKIVDYTA